MNTFKNSRWFDLVGKTVTFLTLFFGSVVLTIHARFLYQICMKLFKISDSVHLSEKMILANYDKLMLYMNNPFQATLSMPNFPSSIQGLKHFSEVKVLFIVAIIVFALAIIPMILYMRQVKREKSFWKFILPVKIITAIIGCITMLAVIGFDQFFVIFHEILFRNNDWIYDPAKDPVINILPEGYFMACFIFFFVLVFIGLCVLFILGKRELKTK